MASVAQTLALRRALSSRDASCAAPCGGSQTARATFAQASSFGGLSEGDVAERVGILEALNPFFRRKIRFRVFLWKTGRHWAVVLQPDPDGADDRPARVDSDLLRKASDSQAASAVQEEPVRDVPLDQLFVVFELLVAPNSFYLRVSIHPSFDLSRKNVEDHGITPLLPLKEVADNAQQVVRRFSSYGIFGANCQHFAAEFLKKLNVSEDRLLVTEDQRAARAAAKGVGAVGVAGAGAAGYTAVGAGVGMTAVLGGAGLLVLAGGAAMLGVHKGYDRLYREHRKSDVPLASARGSL